MTLDELASTIRNRIADGLSGNIADQAFSLAQLKDEIDLQRADFAYKYATTAKLDIKYMVQEISALEIVCRNLSDDCLLQAPQADVPSIKIPKILSVFDDDAIQYLGLVNMQEQFSVYYHPDDIVLHKSRIRTKHRPFAWVDLATDADDYQTIYFFNFGAYNALRYVKLRAIFAHPAHVLRDGYISADLDYPAPLHMQNAIIDTLTMKYVEYFRKMNIPSMPNTQTDPIT